MENADTRNLAIIGIDPAPRKGLCVWGAKGFELKVPALQSREWLRQQMARQHSLLVAWDAPVSFDRSVSFSDRPVDKALRAFISEHVKSNEIENKAVSVLTFSGCQHWAITCEVLRTPFGQDAAAAVLPKVPVEIKQGLNVVEVHPAVTLALWWMDKKLAKPMPRYKGSPEACAAIARALDLPTEASRDDDILDAYVAYRMAVDFVNGSAIWVGTPVVGGYVLPLTADRQWGLQERVQRALGDFRKP
jgi:predicted nuclease with RNAse H fold